MDLSIIIVNWKSTGYLRKCLDSIFVSGPGPQWEVVVVDNASNDNCGAMLAQEFPLVKFIPSPKNVGFARANNLGANRSTGDVLLFLNPDTEIIGSAIAVLLQELDGLPRAGAVGCRLLNSDGSLQTSCIQSFPTILNQTLDSEFLRRRFPRSGLWGVASLYSGQTEPSEIEAVSGACLMMRRRVFAAIGGFSTEYFMYSEDIDLCYKARRRGWINYHSPQALVVHHGSGSSRSARTNFAVVTVVESLWRFFKKNQGPAYAALYRAALFATATGRLTALAAGKLLRFAPGNGADGGGSARKWGAILRWSMGRNRCESPLP